MGSNSDLRMNLATLKRVDPYIKDIVGSASSVCLYTFSEEEWEKTEIEGTLFLTQRQGDPEFGIFVLGRKTAKNLVEPINKHLQLTLQSPFLLYKTQEGIFGIWFFEESECVSVYNQLEDLIKMTKGKMQQRERRGKDSSEGSGAGAVVRGGRGTGGGGGGGGDAAGKDLASLLNCAAKREQPQQKQQQGKTKEAASKKGGKGEQPAKGDQLMKLLNGASRSAAAAIPASSNPPRSAGSYAAAAASPPKRAPALAPAPARSQALEEPEEPVDISATAPAMGNVAEFFAKASETQQHQQQPPPMVAKAKSAFGAPSPAAAAQTSTAVALAPAQVSVAQVAPSAPFPPGLPGPPGPQGPAGTLHGVPILTGPPPAGFVPMLHPQDQQRMQQMLAIQQQQLLPTMVPALPHPLTNQLVIAPHPQPQPQPQPQHQQQQQVSPVARGSLQEEKASGHNPALAHLLANPGALSLENLERQHLSEERDDSSPAPLNVAANAGAMPPMPSMPRQAISADQLESDLQQLQQQPPPRRHPREDRLAHEAAAADETEEGAAAAAPKLLSPAVLATMAAKPRELRRQLNGGGGAAAKGGRKAEQKTKLPNASNGDMISCASTSAQKTAPTLNQEQLVQAMQHLLLTDPTFVGKLHQAYADSCRL